MKVLTESESELIAGDSPKTIIRQDPLLGKLVRSPKTEK